ncbi:MAG: TrmH family RNA methyltransferase [Treponema sp.]|jgi:TrmH family RNA methyltransferase|nr:TrmH family RNA methyltransferase [Treponema sp.]
MIPLHKLEKLPRSQRLRKIGKTFAEAELRLLRDGQPLSSTELIYFADTLKILLQDTAFSAVVTQALRAALEILHAEKPEAAPVLRALNSIKHLLLAETGRYPADWDFVDGDGKLESGRRRFFAGMQVYLEDIRSPFNVGAMFRTAESFGVEKLWLSPLCADPHHPRAERTAMGCVEVLDWERLSEDPFIVSNNVLNSDRNELLKVPNSGPFMGPFFALETGGVPLAEFPFPRRGIMIVGSEELGVSPQALARSDASLGRVSIPTFGAKGSLNASVAFGIAMQAFAAGLSG